MLPALLLGLRAAAPAQGQLLDDFERLDGWKTLSTHGEAATITIRSAAGRQGKALEMDFAFSGFMGGVMAFKEFPLTLPPDFRFSFDLKADAPVNNFEFRLVDSLGNVWWNNRLNYIFPRTWTTIHAGRRQFPYAWGPSWGGDIRRLARIEFNVSVVAGGAGKIWIDNLRLERLDERSSRPLIAQAFGTAGSRARVLRGDTALGPWRSPGSTDGRQLTLRLQHRADIGGVVLRWDSADFARRFTVQLSDDGRSWSTVYRVQDGNGGRQYLPTGEREAAFVRLDLKRSSRGKGYRLQGLALLGPEFSSSANQMYHAIAAVERPGLYPMPLRDRQSFWTLVGVNGDEKEALLNEQGMLETDKLSFSLEPFLFTGDSLITWHEVRATPSLADGYLPIPSVRWEHAGGLGLTVTALAAGEPDSSILAVRYRIENRSQAPARGTLFVAARPFQVNPPWEIFTIVGGASRIDSIICGPALSVDGKEIVALPAPHAAGAASFDQGDVTRYLVRGSVPPWQEAYDAAGHASGAMAFGFDLPAGGSQDVVLALPFHARARPLLPGRNEEPGAFFERLYASTCDSWRRTLGTVRFALPEPVGSTILSNVAYILINRDGPALQPGSRSYERSWIRDGSMIALALLQMGITREVREYIDWYAQYQRSDGFVPCIVDRRGAEAVPEHDSHGQFISLITNYFRFTRDTLWLKQKWAALLRTARFIQRLRAQSMTPALRNGTPEERACVGLVPASISHEGYSARPMHSYWDNFFCLRGLQDASFCAAVVGEPAVSAELAQEAAAYGDDIARSLRLAMRNKGITFVPGCVELGDQGGLSNTVIVSPLDELERVPLDGLRNDFDQFWREFRAREENSAPWWAYLPYEWRYVDAFVHLGWRKRAHELFDALMRDRRPPAWNHWAESVWKEPHAPKNIGDMPHAWAGSDFLRAVRSMLAYERGDSLVLGAGLPERWVERAGGIRVEDLPTTFGRIGLAMRKEGSRIIAEISGRLDPPHAEIVLVSPSSGLVQEVRGDGRAGLVPGRITITRVPAHVELLLKEGGSDAER